MTIINKAILHILDFNSGVTVFSQQELDIKNSVETFLTKHLEKASSDPGAKTGRFYPDSGFKNRLSAYLDGELDFISFSVYIAGLMYSSIAKSDKVESADLIVCDYSVDSQRLIAILKCNNRVGFTHQVIQSDNGVKNDIINHYAIMPSISQKIDEHAFIDTESLAIRFTDKKRLVDGQEAYIIADNILQCSSKVSSKDAIGMVSAITRKVAENHGQSSVMAVSKAKNYIMENTEKSDYLDPVDLGKEVFAASPMMQEEYMREVIDAGIAETVKIDKEFAQRKGRSHKIKTDTGIEITFPVDYFQNTDFIEFVNNSDGTISIQLKNIGKLINK
jgi:hypothetical protein